MRDTPFFVSLWGRSVGLPSEAGLCQEVVGGTGATRVVLAEDR